MIDRAKFFFAPAVVAVQLWGSAMAASPDANDGSSLDEVAVTATRRSERLQDVPISVSAFSQEKLDAQGLHSIDDLTRLAPGVAFQRNGMSSAGNVTNTHPQEYLSRDIAITPPPGSPYSDADQTDKLYFGRGVRPRTIGVTATYRY